MFSFFKQLFAPKPKVDFKTLIRNGAQIIDVRTKGEFDHGHIQGSVNIPVQQLQLNLAKIRKDRPIITCCASGVRSDKAKRILLSSGYQDVYNGGGWSDLQNQIR